MSSPSLDSILSFSRLSLAQICILCLSFHLCVILMSTKTFSGFGVCEENIEMYGGDSEVEQSICHLSADTHYKVIRCTAIIGK